METGDDSTEAILRSDRRVLYFEGCLHEGDQESGRLQDASVVETGIERASDGVGSGVTSALCTRHRHQIGDGVRATRAAVRKRIGDLAGATLRLVEPREKTGSKMESFLARSSFLR